MIPQHLPTTDGQHEWHNEMASCILDGVALVEEGATQAHLEKIDAGWLLIERGFSLASNEHQRRQLAIWVIHKLRPLVE
jgi:hypothetical protein